MATKTVANGTSEKFWRRQLAVQLQSGLTQRAFCLRRGLVPGTFAWWKNQLNQRDRRRPAGSRFIPVRVAPRPTPGGGFDVELRSGRHIQVPCPFDADSLRKLVAILEEVETASW